MCSGYKINKHGYGYCNHGFIPISVCKIKDEVQTLNMIPFCCRENSHVSELPDNFNIKEYRERMQNIIPESKGIK
jgi:hypothetical protein